MSDRSILDRYGPRAGESPTAVGGGTDVEPTDDLGSFGFLRGIRDRAVMIELRKKDGNILAVGYGWLERAEFNPSEGITLSIVGQKVRIKGRNLNAEVRQSVRLFEAITRHRISWVQEANEPDGMEADDKATVIDSIEW
jgi:hypothetical protein